MRAGRHVKDVNRKRFFVQNVDLLGKRTITKPNNRVRINWLNLASRILNNA